MRITAITIAILLALQTMAIAMEPVGHLQHVKYYRTINDGHIVVLDESDKQIDVHLYGLLPTVAPTGRPKANDADSYIAQTLKLSSSVWLEVDKVESRNKVKDVWAWVWCQRIASNGVPRFIQLNYYALMNSVTEYDLATRSHLFDHDIYNGLLTKDDGASCENAWAGAESAIPLDISDPASLPLLVSEDAWGSDWRPTLDPIDNNDSSTWVFVQWLPDWRSADTDTRKHHLYFKVTNVSQYYVKRVKLIVSAIGTEVEAAWPDDVVVSDLPGGASRTIDVAIDVSGLKGAWRLHWDWKVF